MKWRGSLGLELVGLENYYYYYFGSIGPFWLHSSSQGSHQWSSGMMRGDDMVMLYGNDPPSEIAYVLYIDVVYKDQKTKKIEWSCPRQAWCSYKKNMDP